MKPVSTNLTRQRGATGSVLSKQFAPFETPAPFCDALQNETTNGSAEGRRAVHKCAERSDSSTRKPAVCLIRRPPAQRGRLEKFEHRRDLLHGMGGVSDDTVKAILADNRCPREAVWLETEQRG
jgi:hypothetical protein